MSRIPIQKRTIRRLRTAASKYFSKAYLDDASGKTIDPYRVFLAKEYEVASTLDLSEEQGVEALAKIDRMAKTDRKKKSQKRIVGKVGNTVQLLSLEQKEFINGLFDQLAMDSKERRFGFIRKQISTPKAVDWLTPSEATKVITGLKRMLKVSNMQLDKRLNPVSDELLNN
ncbi:MAG: DUF1018 domain-containing protein [Balneolaceae bacterium]